MNDLERRTSVRRRNYRREQLRRRRMLRNRFLIICAALLILAIFIFLVKKIVGGNGGAASSTSVLSSGTSSAVVSSEVPSQAPASSQAASSQIVSSQPVISIAPAVYDFTQPVPAANAVDDSYFDDALFIGDSRIDDFILYVGPGDVTVYAGTGSNVRLFYTEAIINVDDEKVTIAEALRRNAGRFKKIYFKYGLNELGWESSQIFIEEYAKVIDEAIQYNPDAVIYVQSILPVTQERDESDKVFNKANIDAYNTLIKKMCADKKLYYVNAAESVAQADGYIPADSAYDGIHLKKDYCTVWLNYLKTHTVQKQEN